MPVVLEWALARGSVTDSVPEAQEQESALDSVLVAQEWVSVQAWALDLVLVVQE